MFQYQNNSDENFRHQYATIALEGLGITSLIAYSVQRSFLSMTNHLISQHSFHQITRLILIQRQIDQEQILRLENILTAMPSELRESFTDIVLSLEIEDSSSLVLFSTLIAASPLDRRTPLVRAIQNCLSSWVRSGMPIDHFTLILERMPTNERALLVFRLAAQISQNIEILGALPQVILPQYFRMMQRVIMPAFIAENQNPVLLNLGERWTEGVANHVNEIHDDARLRQVAHENSLTENAKAKDFFNATILEYLQSSSRSKDELIEDFESCSPEIYLDIIKAGVLKAINSERPLMSEDGSSQILPLALLSVGNELEVLRKNQYIGGIKGLASELQQKTSIQVAIQTAMASVQESTAYLQWKSGL